MADYTEVPDVTTGDTWTADNQDTYLRNNFKAVFDGVADGAPVMKSDDGLRFETYSNYAKYTVSSNVTITKGGVYTTINHWNTALGNSSWLSSSTNITPGAGIYRVSCQICLGIEDGKYFYISLRKTSGGADTTEFFGVNRNNTGGSTEIYGSIPSVIVSLAAGDYLWLRLYNANTVGDSILYAIYTERIYLNVERIA